jgi:hypothetical protein
MQTRLGSFIESSLNTLSGFFISFFLWQLVGPWFGYTVTFGDNFLITSIFTVASIARSYVWRRCFNNRQRTNPTQPRNVL